MQHSQLKNTARLSCFFALIFILLSAAGCKSTQTPAEGAPNTAADAAAAPAETAAPAKAGIKTIAIDIYHPNYSVAISDPNDEENPVNTYELSETIFASIVDDRCIRNEDFDEIEEIKGKCQLKSPFITESQYKQFDLKPGDKFRAEEDDTIVYEVLNGIPEDAALTGDDGGFYAAPFIPCESLEHKKDCGGNRQPEKIIRVKAGF